MERKGTGKGQGNNGFVEVVLCAIGSKKAKRKEKNKKEESKNQFKPNFPLFRGKQPRKKK